VTFIKTLLQGEPATLGAASAPPAAVNNATSTIAK